MIRQAHTYLAGAVSGTALIAAAVAPSSCSSPFRRLKDWPFAGLVGGGDGHLGRGRPGAGGPGGAGAAKRRPRATAAAGRQATGRGPAAAPGGEGAARRRRRAGGGRPATARPAAAARAARNESGPAAPAQAAARAVGAGTLPGHAGGTGVGRRSGEAGIRRAGKPSSGAGEVVVRRPAPRRRRRGAVGGEAAPGTLVEEAVDGVVGLGGRRSVETVEGASKRSAACSKRGH